jgi:hypothetical protein
MTSPPTARVALCVQDELPVLRVDGGNRHLGDGGGNTRMARAIARAPIGRHLALQRLRRVVRRHPEDLATALKSLSCRQVCLFCTKNHERKIQWAGWGVT